jgi:hypothetical protein
MISKKPIAREITFSKTRFEKDDGPSLVIIPRRDFLVVYAKSV